MNPELAVTISCTNTGCQVKLVKSDEVIETKYSDLVHDRIRIEPLQLVVVDTVLRRRIVLKSSSLELRTAC